MPRRPISARDALRRAYESKWESDALAQDYAVAVMVMDGWAHDVAEAAVVAAFNQHYRIMGAV